jgi:parallel beta-helix repeat protein
MHNQSSSPVVTSCTFSHNTAYESGGGMHNRFSSSPTVTGCAFSDNSAANGGGGMGNDSSSPTVTNCTFSGNSAEFGGGMGTRFDSPTVTSCTFSGNAADSQGGGMFNYSSSPALTNSILWGDTAPAGSEIYNFDSDASAASYSDIQGGYEGTGNIDADPLFVSTTDLHLQSTSPCIDTGSNDAVPDDLTTDLDGNPRIVDGDDDSTATVDMGAYEYQP